MRESSIVRGIGNFVITHNATNLRGSTYQKRVWGSIMGDRKHLLLCSSKAADTSIKGLVQ